MAVYPTALGVELYRPILLFSVFIVIALLFALIRREGFPLLSVAAYVFILTVAALLGAKAFSILVHGELRPLPDELGGGLRFPGALFGVLTFGWLLRGMLPAGLTLARLADLWAPCFALACAIGRFGCLMKGCCYGAFTHLPWSIRYPRGSIPWWHHFDGGQIDAAAPTSLPVHPFPLYLLSMELAVFGLTWWLLPRKTHDGQVVLVFLAVHGTLKTALEFTRDPYDPLHQAIFPVALAAALGLALQWRRLKRAPDAVHPARA
jgi:phosphatidylglycerol:prolipoprotein diacylglycerol transferase